MLCHSPWVEARTTIFGLQSASPLAISDRSSTARAASGRGGEPAPAARRLGFFARPLAPPTARWRTADPDLEGRSEPPGAGLPSGQLRALSSIRPSGRLGQYGAGAPTLTLAETRTIDIPTAPGDVRDHQREDHSAGARSGRSSTTGSPSWAPAGCRGSAANGSMSGRRG